MRSNLSVLAVDLGAASGRVMAVNYDGNNFELKELHRFLNIPIVKNGTLYWDISRLWQETKAGLEKGKSLKPASMGVDAWGVDFALLDKQGILLDNPVHYRDRRTDGMQEKVIARISKQEIYSQTGIQILPINTLFQLSYLVEKQSPVLLNAETFLTIPDLFNYWLVGVKACEFTNATTTQLYNPLQKNWAESLINKLQIPYHIFPDVISPGIQLGKYDGIDVMTVAAHDTASAVAAVPTEIKNFTYISSGTWSLVGQEIAIPLINESALKANITNEGGVFGTFLFLKNVMGLWLIQECQRIWRKEGENYTSSDLVKLAKQEPPLRSLIIPDDPQFLHQGNFPQMIANFCQITSQPMPTTPGAIVRCVLDSLALDYKNVLEKLVGISNRPVELIHIVGGGSQNDLLNQLTANATGLSVFAGPAEATVLGNAIVQLITLGEIKNLSEARQIVAKMRGIKRYEPKDSALWDEAYQRFLTLQKQF